MKRLVSLFLILAVLTSSFLFAGGSTAFASDDVWVKDIRRDAFGDPTDEWIITNSELFSGTFNGDAADSAPLGVRIEVDGNVSFENAVKMRAAGADLFVGGSSSVFCGDDIAGNIRRIGKGWTA